MARRPVAAALTSDDQDQNDERDRRAALALGPDDQEEDEQQEGDDEEQEDEEQEDDAEAQADDDGSDELDDEARERQRRQPRQRRQDDDGEEDRITAAERRAIEAEARLNALLEQRQPQQPTETPEQEAARLALMTPEQLIDYRVNKALAAHQKTTQQAVLSASNAADKASFDNLVTQQPLLRKVAADVEKKHAEFVRQGQYPTRETVLTYLLGERALAAMRKAQPEARERQRRVERQQVRPTNNRSDVQPQRRGGKTLEQRLENVAL